jgi:uncharacterized membrane protein
MLKRRVLAVVLGASMIAGTSVASADNILNVDGAPIKVGNDLKYGTAGNGEYDCTDRGTAVQGTATLVRSNGGDVFLANDVLDLTGAAHLTSDLSKTTITGITVATKQVTVPNPWSDTNGSDQDTAPFTFNTTVAPTVANGEYTMVLKLAKGMKSVTGDLKVYVTCSTVTANSAPVVDAGGPYSGNEGSAISLNGGSFTDTGDSSTHSYLWTVVTHVSPGSCTLANATSLLGASITCNDNGAATVRLTVTDGPGLQGSDTATVNVSNVNPTLSITAPTGTPVHPVGTTVNLTTAIGDAGSNDTHTCTINWDNGLAAVNLCNAAYTFNSAGVYSVLVNATDDDGGPAPQATVMIVIFDPTAGFVTGGGWINSPAGAYVADTSMVGKANFGFVSKYQKGATIPTGQTEFQFHAGSLNFNSTSYQWLVVSGAKAQYKGSGTINGAGDYGFLLTANDGSPDKFRIKMWNKVTGAVVYDNMPGAPDDIDTAAPQSIDGGSIVIHIPKR